MDGTVNETDILKKPIEYQREVGYTEMLRAAKLERKMDQAHALVEIANAREIAKALDEASRSSERLGSVALKLQGALIALTVVIALAAVAQVVVTWKVSQPNPNPRQIQAPADSVKTH